MLTASDASEWQRLKGVGALRSSSLGFWTLLICSFPHMGMAERPITCPVYCAVYESYCMGPDEAIQSASECPGVPPEDVGTESEVIGCAFTLGDTTVEGTCGWSRLGDYDSSDCERVSTVPVEPSPCEAVDVDGVAVSGVCEGGCDGTYGYEAGGDSSWGCQALAASQLLPLFWLVSVMLGLRRWRRHGQR